MFTLILDDTLKETTVQGTKAFPYEIYMGGATMFDKGYLDWHWHDYFEINLVRSENLHYFIENEEYLLHPGEAVFINAGRLHRGYSDYPVQMSNTIVFSGELFCGDISSQWYASVIEQFIKSDINGFVLTADVPWMKEVLLELDKVYEEYRKNTTTSQLLIKGYMCIIFANILANTTYTSRPTDVETEKMKRLHSMLSHISHNYMNPITLTELSVLAGLSETECSRFFTKQMKQTPFSYINRYRIERSCELLVNTDISISEIALQTGYNSFSYYSKRFREIMNCSPSEYREKIREAIRHEE